MSPRCAAISTMARRCAHEAVESLEHQVCDLRLIGRSEQTLIFCARETVGPAPSAAAVGGTQESEEQQEQAGHRRIRLMAVAENGNSSAEDEELANDT